MLCPSNGLVPEKLRETVGLLPVSMCPGERASRLSYRFVSQCCASEERTRDLLNRYLPGFKSSQQSRGGIAFRQLELALGEKCRGQVP